MEEKDIKVSNKVETILEKNEQKSYTCVIVAINFNVIGVIIISDPIKPEAFGTIKYLENMGILCWLLSGDNMSTVNAVAEQVGINSDRVFGQVLPQNKSKKVKELQDQGYIVAMIGDGINDSPALVQADIGIAIGAGTDVAIEAADIVLIKSHLFDVVTAIDLSKKTFKRIKLNYLWALLYNIIAIPLAAGILSPLGIFIPPLVAGVAMAISSISVVLSSVELQNYKKPKQPIYDFNDIVINSNE